MSKFVAILSTTVLPLDGIYMVETVSLENVREYISGTPHFVGHPSTKAILDELGAIHTPGLFKGLQAGEIALCCAIAQGKSSRSELGKTVDQEIRLEDLTWRVIRKASKCAFCGQEAVLGWACANCGAI